MKRPHLAENKVDTPIYLQLSASPQVLEALDGSLILSRSCDCQARPNQGFAPPFPRTWTDLLRTPASLSTVTHSLANQRWSGTFKGFKKVSSTKAEYSSFSD